MSENVAVYYGDSLYPHRNISTVLSHARCYCLRLDTELGLEDKILRDDSVVQLLDASSISKRKLFALKEIFNKKKEIFNNKSQVVILYLRKNEQMVKELFENYRLCCIDSPCFKSEIEVMIKVLKKQISSPVLVSLLQPNEQMKKLIEKKSRHEPEMVQSLDGDINKVLGVVLIISGQIMETEYIAHLKKLETKRKSGNILHILVVLDAKFKEDHIRNFKRDFPDVEYFIKNDEDEKFINYLDKKVDEWLDDTINKIRRELQDILCSELEVNTEEKLSTLRDRLQYWLAICGERETKEKHVVEEATEILETLPDFEALGLEAVGDLPDEENEGRLMIKPGQGNKADSGVQQDLPAGEQAENYMKAPTDETVGSQEKETKNSSTHRGPSSGYASMN